VLASKTHAACSSLPLTSFRYYQDLAHRQSRRHETPSQADQCYACNIFDPQVMAHVSYTRRMCYSIPLQRPELITPCHRFVNMSKTARKC
jgi:hypothetical protein